MKSKEELEVELENIPDPIKRNTRRDLIENGLDAPVVIEGIKQSRVFLDKLEFELSKSEWLFNDSFGIADAAALPYIIRLEQLALGELFNVSTRPNICDWYGKIKIMQEKRHFALLFAAYHSKQKRPPIGNISVLINRNYCFTLCKMKLIVTKVTDTRMVY
jgi:glutathione S-transferase